MIFPIIECDGIVQIKDKFRIGAMTSYKTPDEALWDTVEIEAETGAGFIDVTGDPTKPNPNRNWFLDYQYASAGTKTISLRITIGLSIVTVTKDVEAITAATDNLFSTDDLLKEQQSDIFRLLPDGRASFKYKHRAAQNFILDWLWNNGFYKSVGAGAEPFLKADIVDIDYISDWSTYVTLRMLYEENQSQGGDVFRQKALDFLQKETYAREKCILKIDTDNSGDLSVNEGVSIQSRRLIRV